MSGPSSKKTYRLLLALVSVALVIALGPPLALFLAFLLLVRTLIRAPSQPAEAPSHRGTALVSPSKVVAGGEPVPVTIRYTVGPDGIRDGGALRLCPGKVLRFSPEQWRLCLQWANGWGQLQRLRPERPNYLEVVTSSPEVRLDVSLMEKAADRTQLMWLKRKFWQKLGFELAPIDPRDGFLENMKVTVRVSGGTLVDGDKVTFVMGKGAGIETPRFPMNTDFAIEVDSSGNGRYRLEASVPAPAAVGGKPARFDVVAPTIAAPGEEVLILMRCLDGRGVLTPDFSGRVFVSVAGPLDVPVVAVFPDANEGTAWLRCRPVGTGIARVEVRDEEGRLEGASNPVVCASPPYRVLWGDLHTHSLVSDGTQEPWFMYHRARDLMGWDFTAVTDHDIWSLGEERPRSSEELDLMMRLADRNNSPGRFVTFRSYEWTHHALGHRNVIFGPSTEPVFMPHTDARYATPERLLRVLESRDVLVVPHHPAWKTHAGEMHFDFGPAGDTHQKLIEVYSRHGNSEFFGCPRPISHVGSMEGIRGAITRAFLGREYAGENSGSYVRDALASGHRFGLIAGSDEHIVGTDPRKGPGQAYGGGTTGIFAEARTRESAWKALAQRRVCGTTGVRMLLELRVNGSPQGAEITAESAPRITGHVLGTADLQLVELLKFDSDGYTTPWQGGGEGPEAVIDFTDTRFREDSFYYLRVVQADGNMGWAGPTWVDRA